ncbi:DUF4282 domain-containing protein [Candidatus Saccharibacteria bacterium]|nr:DUF4282 domain-containing protein [Candidatus Saccharibacteria bacterium]
MFLMRSTQSGLGGSTSSPVMNPWVIAGGVIFAFIITIVVFITVVEKKKAPRSRFFKWLREFLNFRSTLISGLIKFVYLFLATTLTVIGIILMFSGQDEMFLMMMGIGFAVIIFGNIFLRIFLELIMVSIGTWENTSDIRSVLIKEEEKPEEKAPKKEKKEEVIAEAPVETPTETLVEASVEVPVEQPPQVAQEPPVPPEPLTPPEPPVSPEPQAPSPVNPAQ